MLSLSVNLFLAWGAKKNQNQTLDTELHEQKPNLYSGAVWSPWNSKTKPDCRIKVS